MMTFQKMDNCSFIDTKNTQMYHEKNGADKTFFHKKQVISP